jgi:hypothetical protein
MKGAVKMNKIRTNRGQALVEFAIILPVLLMMMFGLLDVGRGVVDYSIINSAAREGTRWGVVQPGGGNPYAIMTLVSDKLGQLLGLGPVITVASNNASVCVYINLPFKPITPFFKDFNLQAQSEMADTPYATSANYLTSVNGAYSLKCQLPSNVYGVQLTYQDGGLQPIVQNNAPTPPEPPPGTPPTWWQLLFNWLLGWFHDIIYG